MSLTVEKVVQVSPFLWRTEKDGSHVLKCTAKLKFEFTRFGIRNTDRVKNMKTPFISERRF